MEMFHQKKKKECQHSAHTEPPSVHLLTRLLLRLLTQLPFSLLSSGLLCSSFPASPFTAPTQIST